MLVEVRFDRGKQMENGRNGARMNNERLVDGVVQRMLSSTARRYQTVRLLQRLVHYWRSGGGVDRRGTHCERIVTCHRMQVFARRRMSIKRPLKEKRKD